MKSKYPVPVIRLSVLLVFSSLLLAGAFTARGEEDKKSFNWNAVLVSIVSQDSAPNPNPTPPPSNESCSGSSGFTVCTTSFTNGGTLDSRYTLYGSNISPHLVWKNPPAGTASYGIWVYDKDATDSTGSFWSHWNVKIPATTTELAENAGAAGGGNLPEGAERYNNSFYGLNIPNAAGTDYDGPMPPSGTGEHRYYFVVYALDSNNQQLEQAYLVGKYSYQGSIEPPAPPDN